MKVFSLHKTDSLMIAQYNGQLFKIEYCDITLVSHVFTLTNDVWNYSEDAPDAIKAVALGDFSNLHKVHHYLGEEV